MREKRTLEIFDLSKKNKLEALTLLDNFHSYK